MAESERGQYSCEPFELHIIVIILTNIYRITITNVSLLPIVFALLFSNIYWNNMIILMIINIYLLQSVRSQRVLATRHV